MKLASPFQRPLLFYIHPFIYHPLTDASIHASIHVSIYLSLLMLSRRSSTNWIFIDWCTRRPWEYKRTVQRWFLFSQDILTKIQVQLSQDRSVFLYLLKLWVKSSRTPFYFHLFTISYLWGYWPCSYGTR